MSLKLLLIINLIIITTGSENYLTCSRPNKNSGVRSGKYLRMQERVVKRIPCDLRGSGFCNIPGDFYPWHAVRAFVSENQGLVRRMYGEVRQLSVLRSEIEKNELLTNEIDTGTGPLEKRTVTKEIEIETSTSSPTTLLDETIATTEYETTTESFVEFFSDVEKRNSAENVGVVEEKPILKAVNACPVKEEVVAPYWANNTRGEVLALLNLYPFEQYVHWEKCDQEMKQMFCRSGCRCEQQYRLHRLLAFDPTNECRGIFSDWFRFPSCCVCKCYLTEEEIKNHYRNDITLATSNSRSPRRFEFETEIKDFDEEDQPDVGGVWGGFRSGSGGFLPRK